MAWNPNYKHCDACNVNYDGDDCPSCNPKTYYYVEIAVPFGPDDFEFQPCECGDCPENGYWDKDEAIKHAKAVQKFDGGIRVCNENGQEVWSA